MRENEAQSLGTRQDGLCCRARLDSFIFGFQLSHFAYLYSTGNPAGSTTIGENFSYRFTFRNPADRGDVPVSRNTGRANPAFRSRGRGVIGRSRAKPSTISHGRARAGWPKRKAHPTGRGSAGAAAIRCNRGIAAEKTSVSRHAAPVVCLFRKPRKTRAPRHVRPARAMPNRSCSRCSRFRRIPMLWGLHFNGIDRE